MATFTVNGQSVTVEKNQKLIRYLRDTLHLTSVKDGCSEGACGTCHVLIDGKPTKACIPQTDKLEGKTILITGAAGGIGAAISKGLADAGAEVALCGRTLSKCQALADEITEKGGKATAHFLDVADMSTIQPCVDEVVERYGKIDVLFNIAGINKREGLLDVTEETYDRIMDTNLKGVYFVSQAVGREMYKRKTGSIVNIGSLNDTIMLGLSLIHI